MFGRRLLRTAIRTPCRSYISTSGSAGGSKPSGRPTPKTEVSAADTGLRSVVIGGGAGLLGSFVGMGGGFVAIPALTGWLRLTQHQAHGTSLGAVFATGAAGSTAYTLSGHVDYEAATAMAVAGMVASYAGARSTAGVSPTSLKLALGALMITVAPLLPLRDELSRREEVDESTLTPAGPSADRSSAEQPDQACGQPPKTAGIDPPRSPVPNSNGGGAEAEKVLKMFAIGLGSGFLAGVFGVGGGVVTVPAISVATDLSHKEVLGTSLAAMVLPALTGSATHWRQGNLLPRIAFPLAVGTGVGAFVGGNYAARFLDESSLKWAFATMMILLGGRTIAGARKAARSLAAKSAS